MAIGLVLGLVLERGVLRFVYGKDEVVVVLVTYACFLILEDVIMLIWGTALLRGLPADGRGRQHRHRRADRCRTTTSCWSRSPPVLAIAVYWALKYTRYGRLLNVVIFDRETAAAFGINVTVVFTVTFVIGAMLGALGGAVMAPKISVTLGIGVEVIVLAFAVVATGGMGSIEGALIGALIVGLCRAGAVHLDAAARAVRHLRGDGAGADLPPLRSVHARPSHGRSDMGSLSTWLGALASPRWRRSRRSCRRGWFRSPPSRSPMRWWCCGLIILWRAGLVPFGQALFYAIGAYAVALIGRYTPLRDVFVMIAVAAVAAGLVAFLVGFLLARYRDIFFAMLSLAMSMILWGVLVKSETLGSTDGFHVEAGTLLRLPAAGRHAEPRRCTGWCSASRRWPRSWSRSISARSPARWRCRCATTKSASSISASRSTA